MRSFRAKLGFSILIVVGITLVIARGVASQTGRSSAGVERGRYLVESVAMCQECHTPRDDKGELDRSKWLRGGTHGYRPLRPAQDWADQAPALAGLPGWLDDKDVVYFLENGQRRDGKRPRPPMKQFKLRHEDATAVVAYLRSLPAGP